MIYFKKWLYRIIGVSILFLLIFLSDVSAQTDIYVDAQNGDNRTGDGSTNSPYKTITFALAKSNADGIPDPWHVHIRPGTYDADATKVAIDREIFPLKLRDGMIIEGTTAEECIVDAPHGTSDSLTGPI